MCKICFLDRASLGDVSLAPIAALGELVCYETSAPHQVAERIADAEVIITNKVLIGRAEIDAAPALRLICVAATGTNNIDLDYAAERGIPVRNVAGYSTESVVQTTFMHLLNLVGQAPHYDHHIKSGAYSHSGLFTYMGCSWSELHSKRIGIIGLGTIGNRVAAIAEAFGMEVVYYPTSGKAHSDRYPALSLDELLTTADVVSIHAPLNEQTRGLLGYAELCRMKPSAILLNAGRGGIVDEAALAQALDEGCLAGAGLDVFAIEPLPADSPLLSMAHPERLSLTPHTAWASREARERLVAKIAENIRTTL
ncbi:MAG: D-2-hydroxyacid dehydrogenase [Alistipes sp.]|nr:D-2-hydroxyacid dehydrogenase [Alistipes sp.]MBQ3082617.1 D-2-hydroxyacid dehydrogenase [Alistipes sp.]